MNSTSLRKVIFTSIAIMLSAACMAQNKHEVSFFGGGGLSSLSYSPKEGKQTDKAGFSGGIDYNFYFTPGLSIKSGVALSTYNSEFKMNSFADKYATIDMSGEAFELQYQVDNYHEKQNMTAISIPIMLQYETQSINRFYIAGGVKLAFPVKTKSDIASANIKAQGYYSQWNETPLDEPEFMGFGNFTTQKSSYDVDLSTAVMLSLETGMKWKLQRKLSLYTGVYCDLGVNNISKEKNKNMLVYNKDNPSNYTFNSVLCSGIHNNGEQNNLVKKISPMAIGFKIGLAIEL